MIGRVVGLGQRAGGDDGVGPAVIDRLRVLAPRDIELLEIAEPCALIPLLATPVPVVIVDAVVMDRSEPGTVVEIDADALPQNVRSVSTHGVGLAQALAIARVLAEFDGGTPSIRIVGVTIGISEVRGMGLSAAAQAAVPRAVECVLRVLRVTGPAAR